jgi:hypothetical protein
MNYKPEGLRNKRRSDRGNILEFSWHLPNMSLKRYRRDNQLGGNFVFWRKGNRASFGKNEWGTNEANKWKESAELTKRRSVSRKKVGITR